jgi:hypothetical protein
VKYIISGLITVLILPSIYFAYQLIEEKKYQHQIDLFMDNEFSQKGITILYKKTKFNEKPKKLELGFLAKKYSENEIKKLNQRLQEYDIKNTTLIVMQDTTDLKSDILNEINFKKSELSQKDVSILNLKKEIASNTYDNKALLAEIKILFPEVDNISMSNHTFNVNTDSSRTVPVLIYKSKEELSTDANQKLSLWLQQRLSKNDVETYRQPIKVDKKIKEKEVVKK